MRFQTVAAVLVTVAYAVPAAAQVRQYVFGLDPTGHYDIHQGGILIEQDVAPEQFGQLVFDSPGTVSTVIVPAGTLADLVPPAPVTDLIATGSTVTSVDLRWTATGDDGTVGNAASYDLRYATSPLNDSNWGNATRVPGLGNPKASGSIETFTVNGLIAETTYYFALEVLDEEGNRSGLSNVASRTTQPPQDLTAPSAVLDLAAEPIAEESIRLTWTAPGDDGTRGTATTYDLRYSLVPITGENWPSATRAVDEPAPQEAGSAESYVLEGLTPGTKYYAALKTADEAQNWSGLSNVPSATTFPPSDSTPPARIETLAVTSVTATTVNLAWTAPGDDGMSGRAASYDLRYSLTPIEDEASWAAADQATGEPTPKNAGQQESYQLAGLQAETTYFIAIRARDEAENLGAISNVVEARTADELDTEPPGAITVTATSIENRAAHLSWTAPADDDGAGVTSYEGRRRTAQAIRTEQDWEQSDPLDGLPPPQAPGRVEVYELPGLAPGTSYTVAIRARDAAGNLSAIGTPATFVTTSAPDTLAPSPITDLGVTGATVSSLTLAWTSPADRIPEDCLDDPDVDRYEIRYGASASVGSDGWEAGIPVDAPDPSAPGVRQIVVVTALASQTTYYIAMRARDPRGNWSEPSNVAEGTTLPPEELPDTIPPGAIRELAGAAVSPDSVRLSWLAPGGDGDAGRADHYDLRRGFEPLEGASWDQAVRVGSLPCSPAGTVDSIGVGDLDSGRTHYFALRALDEAGNAGPVCASIAVATPMPPDTAAPAAIVDLLVIDADSSSIVLRWTTPADDGGALASYELRGSRSMIDKTTWSGDSLLAPPPVGDGPGTVVEFLVPDLPSGTRFALALRSRDEAGNLSALSNVAWGETDSVVVPADPTDIEPPAAVDDLRAEALDATRIEITWTAVGDDGRSGRARAYEMRRASHALDDAGWGDATPVPLTLTPAEPGSVERIVVNSLSPDTEYHFALRVSDEEGNVSALSNDAGARTDEPFDTSPPTAPIGMGTTIELDCVIARWEPSIEPDVVAYLLTRSNRTDPAEPPLAIDGITGTAWRDTSLAPDVEYAYSVQALDASGNLSALSRASVVRIPLAAFLPVVQQFSSSALVEPAASGEQGTVQLTWSAAAEGRCAGFAVDRSSDDGETWERLGRVAVEGTGDEDYHWTESVGPGQYLYRIVAVSVRGYERAMPPLAVRWERIETGMVLYGPFPNPCSRSLRLDVALAEAGRVSVRAHDCEGRMLGILADAPVPAGSQSIQIPVDLASGLYFLSVDAGGMHSVRKLIVRR